MKLSKSNLKRKKEGVLPYMSNFFFILSVEKVLTILFINKRQKKQASKRRIDKNRLT